MLRPLLKSLFRRQGLYAKGWKGVSMSEPIEGMVHVKALERTFAFSNFSTAFAFMTRVALQCEKYNHHPQWTNSRGWNTITITWTTDDAGGAVTEKDLMAAKRCSTYAAQMGEVTPATVDESVPQETDPTSALYNTHDGELSRSADNDHGRSVTNKRQESVMPPATEDTSKVSTPSQYTANQSPPKQHAPKANAPKLLNYSASQERKDRIFGILDDMKKTYGNPTTAGREHNESAAIKPQVTKSDISEDTTTL
ncbi:transcriptional coactivator/pterin dehydratase [Saitoella complicata NRRL Y-17804]|uniref:transcriptional coactivator/pterin dehydratase n=1 Tax=Saitoella complicata (strain BCRC 22490 / CBS 7301 / JCM 7358 / NBRC 10748 / NRRL Y-17804) TaxID=698492 RepID=UPI0008678DE7|nr:transcriptional coactivator/pterin dehydratase [Saitoella complicata NRRL Y-17804]ODQ55753.1 transcriptional coactivator/pterin dehydratase [Saitoella complicata NRRL Y-17804]